MPRSNGSFSLSEKFIWRNVGDDNVRRKLRKWKKTAACVMRRRKAHVLHFSRELLLWESEENEVRDVLTAEKAAQAHESR